MKKLLWVLAIFGVLLVAGVFAFRLASPEIRVENRSAARIITAQLGSATRFASLTLMNQMRSMMIETPRIFVGTMYCNEGDFSSCGEMITSQKNHIFWKTNPVGNGINIPGKINRFHAGISTFLIHLVGSGFNQQDGSILPGLHATGFQHGRVC